MKFKKNILLLITVMILFNVTIILFNLQNCFALSNDLSVMMNDDTVTNNEVIDDETIATPAPKVVRDTFSFRYKFKEGDTLIYSVMSKDSITIDYGEPLYRIRFEKIMITCDSVKRNGNFCLTQKLISFNARESHLKEKNIERKNTEWLNIPVYIEIDSLGRRIKAYNPDTMNGVVAPGGPFQPYLFMSLDSTDEGINKKLTNESWLVSGTDTLVENGMPIPTLKYSSLFRMIGLVDTLDFTNVLKMTFIVTGQGLIEVLTNQLKIKTFAKIASGGEIFWDTENWIPQLYIHTMSQKLTIYYPRGVEKVGTHNLYTTYVLDKLSRRK